ncbi:metal ABC transporter permease [Streptococcus thoraltensis]|uniref:metal ABC transporter permease n=1 Tax=Streptococcus thoraltensis TaxID=55085 RepID=UPI000377EF55|nr:metal ABC transporter permease [Streptococcus thoraltensis]MDY4762018.1 metal ABC transporter permease [Streptococcus thoraltensis]
MLSVLMDYSFLTVAFGTSVFALASSLLGSLSVLKRQSLIGDAIGHASYPGVILAFMVFESRNPLLLMLGAMVTGLVSYGLIYIINTYSKQSFVNALSLVSASFFGLGMVLKNLLQGNPHYQNASQAGLQTYLFGQAAFIQKSDIYLILGVSLLSLGLFFCFFQRLTLYLFDEGFAQVSGLPLSLIKGGQVILMTALIAVGLKVVGAILMSSFLIAPSVFGLLLGKTYKQSLVLGSLMAIASAFLGSLMSSSIRGMSTGPAIIVCMTCCLGLAFFWSTYIRKENRRV